MHFFFFKYRNKYLTMVFILRYYCTLNFISCYVPSIWAVCSNKCQTYVNMSYFRARCVRQPWVTHGVLKWPGRALEPQRQMARAITIGYVLYSWLKMGALASAPQPPKRLRLTVSPDFNQHRTAWPTSYSVCRVICARSLSHDLHLRQRSPG